MNLFSAVCGALGIWLAYTIMRRIGIRRLAAAGAAGLQAAAPFYGSMSLVAEVYTLQVVMMGVLILLLLHWADDPSIPRLSLAALWTGLCFSHLL
jgi:dolichyl-phosphate-mannose--protein O-mannosyl transferase